MGENKVVLADTKTEQKSDSKLKGESKPKPDNLGSAEDTSNGYTIINKTNSVLGGGKGNIVTIEDMGEKRVTVVDNDKTEVNLLAVIRKVKKQ